MGSVGAVGWLEWRLREGVAVEEAQQFCSGSGGGHLVVLGFLDCFGQLLCRKSRDFWFLGGVVEMYECGFFLFIPDSLGCLLLPYRVC